jgi:cell wall-associated NlpC family hydrolase
VKLPYRLLLSFFALVLLVPAGTAQARTKAFGARTLELGDRGKDVKTLQKYLTRAGHDAQADGVFGSGTKTAVEEFERAQNRRIDGRFTRTDATALKDVVTNGGAIGSATSTGGATMAPPPEPAVTKLGPGMKATIGPDGLAIAPAAAPPQVQAIIAAGNRIAKKPYIYGGGHGKWEDAGYDCSGSVSYALHGAGLLDQSMPSGGFMKWGDAGPGQWVTLYAHGGHIYMTVAGLRFDTSGRSRAGTRWQADMRSASGYSVRHPPGL